MQSPSVSFASVSRSTRGMSRHFPSCLWESCVWFCTLCIEICHNLDISDPYRPLKGILGKWNIWNISVHCTGNSFSHYLCSNIYIFLICSFCILSSCYSYKSTHKSCSRNNLRLLPFSSLKGTLQAYFVPKIILARKIFFFLVIKNTFFDNYLSKNRTGRKKLFLRHSRHKTYRRIIIVSRHKTQTCTDFLILSLEK